MPSSRFSSPKRYYKRPAVCIKSPAPYPELEDPYLPPQLTAQIQIADWSPPFPAYDRSYVVILTPRPNPTFYGGASPADPINVSLVINRLDPIGIWYHQMIVTAPSGHTKWEGNFWVEPEKHAFNSHLIKRVTVPHQDFRQFKIIG